MTNSSIITEFTSPHFLDSLSFEKPLLIKFHAPWCDDCQNIAPLYEELASKHQASLSFAAINIDEHPMRDYYQSLGIVEIPSFVVYTDKSTHFVKRGDSELEQFVSDVVQSSSLSDQTNFSAFVHKWHQKQTPPTDANPQYELIVIGGGSGGIACARQAAKFTKGRIAIIDWVESSPRGNQWDLGGTCVNVGCVPKFLYHKAAAIGELLHEHAEYFGWDASHAKSQSHSWSKMQESVQLHIKKLNWKYERALRESKVEYIHGKASFMDSNTIKVQRAHGASSLTLQAKQFVIATGGRPVYPQEIKGAKEHCLTSDDIFFLKKAPGKTLVVGGSYIAVETAGFLAALKHGEVALSVRSRMLRNFDEECVEKVEKSLNHVGVRVEYGQLVTSVEKEGQEDSATYKVTFANNHTESFNTVFVATGRSPNTSSLNLQAAKVETNPQGYIQVNEYNQSVSSDNIYALGDVIENAPELTPVAILAGKMTAQRLFLGKTNTQRFVGSGDVAREMSKDGNDKSVLAHVLRERGQECRSLNFVPTTIFSPNEYTSVGLTEEEAKKVYEAKHVRVYRKTVRVLENELHPDHPHDAFGKLICLKTDGERVIGFHFVGPKAGEVCQGMALALKMGARKEDFDYTVGIHPTVAEMFCSLEYGVEEDVGCGCG